MKKTEIRKIINSNTEEDIVNFFYEALKTKKRVVKKPAKKVVTPIVEESYIKENGRVITPEMVNAAISLFEPYLPHEFIKRNSVYARNPVRTVVKKVLETVSLISLNTMIQQYFVDRRDDQFRPSVGTIYEFCTTKFVKIQDFLRPKSGGTRYGLANIPGEKRGEFNEKHRSTIDKLTADKERVNREFKEVISSTNDFKSVI